MKTQRNHAVGKGGFTVVQLVVVLSIIGIIAGMMMEMYSDVPGAAESHKLASDVRSINAAIDVYRTFGGNLDGVNTPQAVIAKLQTKADSITAEQTAGLTGSLVDRRLLPVMLPEHETDTGKQRAIWNAAEKKFVIAEAGGNGVAKFVLDESRAGTMVVEEARPQSLKLAASDGWIWEYGDNSAGAGAGPTKILNVYAGGDGIESGSGSGGSGSGGGSNPGATPLDPPLFSIPSGSYLITDYDLQLYLSNPNAGGISRIIYRVDSGAWSAFNGTPIIISPKSIVTAYAESIDPDYLNSEYTGNEYDVTPVKLDEPLILASADQFDVIDNETIRVTINNPNNSVVSSVKYRIGDGGWATYDGQELELNVYDYADGVTIYAKADATALYYLDSESSAYEIAEPDPIHLKKPVITRSAPKFDYDDNADVVVTLTNPNDSAVSSMEYKVDEKPWADYTEPFTVNVMEHQASAAWIQARAKATDPFYENSDVAFGVVLKPDALFTISGDSNGAFTNPNGGSSMVTNLGSGGTSELFTWGAGANGSDPSWLLFSGDGFVDVSQGERFLLGSLDYYNGTIWSGTGANSVDLNVNLEFFDGTSTNNFDFTVNLLNTVNTQNQVESADYVKLINVFSETTTRINGRDYQLRIEFGETTADGFSMLDEFHVFEDATAKGWLYGTLWLADEG